jgi:hypothetical protein
MKNLSRITSALVLFGSLLQAAAAESTGPGSLDSLAQQVLSSDSSQANSALERLRIAGPVGLDAMFRVYNERIQKQQANPAVKDPDWERLRTAFDTVAEQRDAYASHLYWFTDLNQAKAAARASGKPILSLRLLGNLNEEYSCANSRFFRTTLYPNAEVSSYLRDHFVLHWQSVRPVPRITIDMGDGRRIERTITGNSIHYVLDADGNPIDAFPGLYGAKAFIAELQPAADAEQQASKLAGAERERFLANYHSTRLAEILHQWSADLAQVNQSPSATVGTQNATLDRSHLDALTTEDAWKKIAVLHLDQAALDQSSARLIQFKQPPTAMEAGRLTMSKVAVENPIIRALRNLQHSIAEDTIHNEYQMHTRIYEWFTNGSAPKNLAALNSKIYAELFLTPNSDPWLGLAPADAYSALDNGGLVQLNTR